MPPPPQPLARTPLYIRTPQPPLANPGSCTGTQFSPLLAHTPATHTPSGTRHRNTHTEEPPPLPTPHPKPPLTGPQRTPLHTPIPLLLSIAFYSFIFLSIPFYAFLSLSISFHPHPFLSMPPHSFFIPIHWFSFIPIPLPCIPMYFRLLRCLSFPSPFLSICFPFFRSIYLFFPYFSSFLPSFPPLFVCLFLALLIYMFIFFSLCSLFTF